MAEQQRQRRGDEQVVGPAHEPLADPVPLVVVDHAAAAVAQDAARAGVHDEDPHAPVVAAEAPAAALGLAVGPQGELPQRDGAVFRRADRVEHPVVVEVLGLQVAEVLVDPVRREGAGDALLPPRQPAHVRHPRLGDVPVVVDVVVVEDHPAGDGREQPADHGVPPRLAVERGVLLEVGDLGPRRLRGVAPGGDEVAHRRGDLVGVDLVAEQEQERGQPLRGLVEEAERERPERVDLAAAVVLVLAQAVGRVVRDRHATGAEDDPRRGPAAGRPDDAGRERRVRQRPPPLAVQRDLVRRDRTACQPGDVHERVVVAGDVERPVAAAEHLHGARRVGLHPDGGLVVVDVAEDRAEEKLRHGGGSVPVHAGSARRAPRARTGRAG